MKIRSMQTTRLLLLIAALGLTRGVIFGDTAQITGYLRDNSDKPVAGVEVSGDDYVGDVYPTKTDENGHYTIELKAEGNYRVTVNCDQLTDLEYSCPTPGGATITSGSTELNFTVYPVIPPLRIPNTLLPEGEAGVFYRIQLIAKGGRKPYQWQLAPDSTNLPAGLGLNSRGLISGTPLAKGVSTINVQVTDSNSTVTNKIFTITVNSGSLSASPTVTNEIAVPGSPK